MEMPKPDENGKYHFVYKTTLEGSDKYYIGRHTTKNLNDGYVGSGKWVSNIKKTQGASVLFRSIICFANVSELKEVEQYYIDLHFGRAGCMNYNPGANGFLPGDKHILRGKPNFRKGKKFPEQSGAKHHNFGRPLSASVIQKLKNNWTDEKKTEQSKRISGEGHPAYGTEISVEHRRKVSEALGKGKNNVNYGKGRILFSYYDPEDNYFEVDSLTLFCDKNPHLSYNRMYELFVGAYKPNNGEPIPIYKNYISGRVKLSVEELRHIRQKSAERKRARIDKNFGTYQYYLEDHIITVSDLKQFCKERGLCYRTMLSLYHGKYKGYKGKILTSYKGYRSANPDLISA